MSDWNWLGLYDLSTPEGMKMAIYWTENLISVIMDGGIWIVPRSGAVIRIDRSNKVATVVMAYKLDPAIVKVFEAMGWKVEGRDKLTDEWEGEKN